MTRETFLYRFTKLTDLMFETTSKKNNDYGGDTDPWKNFRDFGKKGILVRMSDKFARLRTGIWEGREFKVAETLRDTLIDLAVYCLILCIWIDEENEYTDLDRTNGHGEQHVQTTFSEGTIDSAGQKKQGLGGALAGGCTCSCHSRVPISGLDRYGHCLACATFSSTGELAGIPDKETGPAGIRKQAQWDQLSSIQAPAKSDIRGIR